MRYTAMNFDGKNVTVDFDEFVDCEFTNCEIIYEGGRLPVFENCVFNNCRFSLKQKADNTLGYLTFLYQNLAGSGGKAFVEEVIAKIKGG